MRLRALTTAGAVLLSAAAFAGLPATVGAAAAAPINPDDCKRAPGVSAPRSTWALDRLQLAKVNPITQGRTVGTGERVTVAVIDSGLDRTHPQLRGLATAPLIDALRNDPGRAYSDCIGHGTQVTAVLAAQRDPSQPSFVGVAPDIRVVPVKVTNGDRVQAADVARGIDLAVNSGAKIANVSLALPVDVPAVRAAVARAQRAGMLIVAAAGNDGNAANQFVQYPAAYATEYDNVLGVGATTAENTVAPFSGSGRYVGVVAPGAGVQTIGVNGGYLVQQGTSFAAPYVSGVAARVLAAHPGMSARTLRERIEATADGPPATVPDTRWGYGTVDPYLAVTSVRADLPAAAPAATRPAPVPAGRVAAAPDRSLQHRAMSLGLGLLALTALVIVTAVVLRGRTRAPVAGR